MLFNPEVIRFTSAAVFICVIRKNLFLSGHNVEYITVKHMAETHPQMAFVKETDRETWREVNGKPFFFVGGVNAFYYAYNVRQHP